MNFAVLVTAAPSPQARTALKFCQALLEADHRIGSLFFYQDGVYCGDGARVTPQDELDLVAAFASLKQEPVLCISSALRRGILDAEEASRYERPAATIADGFRLGGLGEWVEAMTQADRVVRFGP